MKSHYSYNNWCHSFSKQAYKIFLFVAIVKTYDSRKQGKIVKLIAEYNPAMNEHLSDIQILKNLISTYLSPTVQNQLI